MNVPDLGCLPVMRIMNAEKNGSCLEKATILATLHNKALSKELFDLQKQLKGFKYSLFDLNRSLRKRINHPFKYGMTLLFDLFVLFYLYSVSLNYRMVKIWPPFFYKALHFFFKKNLEYFVANLPSFHF